MIEYLYGNGDGHISSKLGVAIVSPNWVLDRKRKSKRVVDVLREAPHGAGEHGCLRARAGDKDNERSYTTLAWIQ